MPIFTWTLRPRISARTRSSPRSAARHRRSAWPAMVSGVFRSRASTNSDRFVMRVIALAMTAITAVAVLAAADHVTYTSYADARPALEALRDVLPPALAGADSQRAEGRWISWAQDHDREIRSRLV